MRVSSSAANVLARTTTSCPMSGIDRTPSPAFLALPQQFVHTAENFGDRHRRQVPPRTVGCSPQIVEQYHQNI